MRVPVEAEVYKRTFYSCSFSPVTPHYCLQTLSSIGMLLAFHTDIPAETKRRKERVFIHWYFSEEKFLFFWLHFCAVSRKVG